MFEIFEGLKLMIIGMSTVFVFLIIMVLTMNFTGIILKIVNKFNPEIEEEPKSGLDRVVKGHEDIAAIIAAIKSYMEK